MAGIDSARHDALRQGVRELLDARDIDPGDLLDALTGIAPALFGRSAPEPPRPDTVVYNVAVLAQPACPLCGDRGTVPATGRGSDGFDPCPDCVAATPDAAEAHVVPPHVPGPEDHQEDGEWYRRNGG